MNKISIALITFLSLIFSIQVNNAQTHVDCSSPVITAVSPCDPSGLSWTNNNPGATMQMINGCSSTSPYSASITFQATQNANLYVDCASIVCNPSPACTPSYYLVAYLNENGFFVFTGTHTVYTFQQSVLAGGTYTLRFQLYGAANAGVVLDIYANGLVTGIMSTDADALITKVSEDGNIQIEGIESDQVLLSDVTGKSEMHQGNTIHTDMKGILMLTVLSGKNIYKKKIIVL